MARRITKALSGLATSFLALGSLVAISPTASAATDTYSFSACVQQKESAHVVLMMDESGSMFEGGTDGNGSDPKNLRIAGAEILLDRLQSVADTYKSTINVQLSGFGDNYVIRSEADWIALNPGSDAGAKQLIQSSRIWADKEALGNSRETDLVSALSGVTNSFAKVPQDSCKLFVFFKDGEDFHSFNSKDGKFSEVPGYEKINDLLKSNKIDAANKAAVRELCRDGGLGDQLRQDPNIYSIGLGVRGEESTLQEGFARFKSLIAGDKSDTCGTGGALPPHGKYLTIEDVSDLPAQFFNILDPSCGEECERGPVGSFTLDMKRALTSFTILSGGVGAGYKISLPEKCSAKAPIEFKVGQNSGETQSAGDGVSYKAKWVGDPKQPQTLSIVFKHEDLNDDSCWVGQWSIDTGNEESQSELEFDADLQASAKFEVENPFVVPGKQGINYTLQIQHPSDENLAPILATDLDPDLNLTVTGVVIDSSSKAVVSEIPALTVSQSDLTKTQILTAPDGLPMGDYELALTLTVNIRDFQYRLKPIVTQQLFQVRSEIAAPTVSGATDFGILKGTDRGKAEIVVTGSPDEDFKLDFSSAETILVAKTSPDGVSYRFAFKADEPKVITVPKNETVKFTVWIEAFASDPKGDGEIHAQTPVFGDFKIQANPVSRPDYFLSVKAGFKAEQHASANGFIRLLVMAAFILLGLLINLLFLKVISNRFAKFPKEYGADMSGSHSIALEFTSEGFNNLESARYAFEDGNFQTIFLKERSIVQVGHDVFIAKTKGLALQDSGHGEIKGMLGFSSEGAKGLTTTNSKPWIPLSLQDSWVFLVTPEALGSAGAGHTATGRLVIIKRLQNLGTGARLAEDFVATADTNLTLLLGLGKSGDSSNGSNKKRFKFFKGFKKAKSESQTDFTITNPSNDLF